MSPHTGYDGEPPTTAGVIALVNLDAQIGGRPASAVRTPSGQGGAEAAAQRLLLIDLLTLRGHVLGRIADYEQAQELAEGLVLDAPHEAMAWLARARTRATFHRFEEARADLDRAELSGLDRATLEAELATILQAIGDHTGARTLLDGAVRRRPDFAALAALAVLQAERGDLAEAERSFSEARRCYRSVSPFALASLDYRRGLMWLHEGDLALASGWLEAGRRRVAAYAPILGCLADIDAARGDHDAAVDRLRPLASSSDDPAYAAGLARALDAAGRPEEAELHRGNAAARYEQLALRHPQAYAGHAADFRRLHVDVEAQARDH